MHGRDYTAWWLPRVPRSVLPEPQVLPPGYHRLRVRAGRLQAEATLVSAPRRCWSPPADEPPRDRVGRVRAALRACGVIATGERETWPTSPSWPLGWLKPAVGRGDPALARGLSRQALRAGAVPAGEPAVLERVLPGTGGDRGVERVRAGAGVLGDSVAEQVAAAPLRGQRGLQERHGSQAELPGEAEHVLLRAGRRCPAGALRPVSRDSPRGAEYAAFRSELETGQAGATRGLPPLLPVADGRAARRFSAEDGAAEAAPRRGPGSFSTCR